MKTHTLLFAFLSLFSLCKAQGDPPETTSEEPLFHDAGIYNTFEYSTEDQFQATPQVWFSLKKFYFEARFNYEERNTLSTYFGYTLSFGKNWQWEVTPMVAGVYGNLQGVSPGINAEIESKVFTCFFQTQYTVDVKDASNSYFWDWTGITFPVGKKGFGVGAGLQVNIPRTSQATIQAGPLLSYNYQKLTIELYPYNFWNKDYLMALGFQYDF